MIDNELIMLDACLNDLDALAAITADMVASDLPSDEAQKIYSAILKLYRQGSPVDYLSVKKESGQELEWFGNYHFMAVDIPGRIKKLKADAAKARLVDEVKRLALQAEKCTLDEAQAALRALNDRQQGTKAGAALKVSHTGDWLFNEPEPMQYILNDVLMAGIIAMIHAVGGCGKSFFIDALVFALVTGAELWGFFKPARAFRVMLFAGEDGEGIKRGRFYWSTRHMADDERETVQRALDNNFVLIAGQPLPLLELRDGNPVESEGFQALMALVKQYTPDVLILDPKSMFYGALDENSNSHNTAFLSVLKKFNEIGVTVLFSHHESKALAGNSTQFSSRGGQALSDGVRWQVSLSAMTTDEAEKYGVDAADYVKVAQTKSNYTRFFEPFYLQRGEHGVLDLAEFQQNRHAEVVDVCRQVLSAGISCRQRELSCSEGLAFRQEVKERCGATLKELRQIIPEAIHTGQIKTTSEGLLYAA